MYEPGKKKNEMAADRREPMLRKQCRKKMGKRKPRCRAFEVPESHADQIEPLKRQRVGAECRCRIAMRTTEQGGYGSNRNFSSGLKNFGGKRNGI